MLASTDDFGVAVLVVATPCPLILAVPVALVAGLSRAAHFGVLIKGAKPLETMARVQTYHIPLQLLRFSSEQSMPPCFPRCHTVAILEQQRM